MRVQILLGLPNERNTMKEVAENFVIATVVMLIIVVVLWFGYRLVEGAGNPASEIDKIKGYCYDRSYPDYKWANGKYYCYRKVTDEMIPVEMPE